MNPLVGWSLAVLALAAGWQGYGWQGLVFAVTLIVFWLVLQFNRSLRAMRNAGASPLGHVASAVMLNAKLRPGMQMLQVIELTKSLGRRVDSSPSAGNGSGAGFEAYAWSDAGGVEVVVTFGNGRCKRWVLVRPGDAAE